MTDFDLPVLKHTKLGGLIHIISRVLHRRLTNAIPTDIVHFQGPFVGFFNCIRDATTYGPQPQ
jgi:hypothetical protein